jgi:predicted acetyltransferase
MDGTSVDAATPREQVLIANLLELYIHDLSAVFPHVELGADGRFGYPDLPRYWSEPDRRFPFVIRAADRVAGFVLVTRGSPASDDPETLDVAEFFVLRAHRRAAVGQRAAYRLWDTLPGAWTVRVSERNVGALGFWRRVVGEYTGGAAIETTRPGRSSRFHVLSF